jgi:hypothetical protein
MTQPLYKSQRNLKTMKTTGRPTKYSESLADTICARLAEGESMRRIARDESMPALSTLFLWLRKHNGFSEQYVMAKQESADAMFEEILDIADNGTNDFVETQGGYKTNSENIQRSRLRIDTRKWMMSKMKPKKYGDKLELDADIQRDLVVTIGGSLD